MQNDTSCQERLTALVSVSRVNAAWYPVGDGDPLRCYYPGTPRLFDPLLDLAAAKRGTRLPGNSPGSAAWLVHTDPWGISHMLVSARPGDGDDGYVVLGPFLKNLPSNRIISRTLMDPLFIRHKGQDVRSAYRALRVLDRPDISSLGQIACQLWNTAWVPVDSGFSHESDATTGTVHVDTPSFELESRVERGHALRMLMMDAVRRGDAKTLSELKADKNLSVVSSGLGLLERVPGNPLRSLKNIMLSHNSLYGFVAEMGGLNAYMSHVMTEKNALLIEQMDTIDDMDDINWTMAFEFCDAVHEAVAAGFSPLVRKAVDHLRIRLDTPVDIPDLAGHLGVAPSHLMRTFKKETGMTIVRFIHRERVEKARFLLMYSDAPIIDIAFAVGFNDHAYFAKVFKRVTGELPSALRI